MESMPSDCGSNTSIPEDMFNLLEIVNLDGYDSPPVTVSDVVPTSNAVASSYDCGDKEMTQIIEQNVNCGPTLNGENEIVNPNAKNSSPSKKRRKLWSKVWDDFTKLEEEDGKEWAVCNHCKKKLVGSSKSGTTHLRNHLDGCPIKKNPGGGTDKSADHTGTCLTTTSANISRGKSKVEEELNRLDETRMITKYWVPLESERDNILEVFKEEKEKLRSYFDKLPGRFNLSIESLYCAPYDVMYVSVHFIDDNWELKRKVIYFDIQDDERSFYEMLKCVITDWNMDKDMCSIVDTYEECDKIMKWVSEIGSLPLAGAFSAIHWFVDRLHHGPDHFYHLWLKIWQLNEYVSRTSSKSVGIKLTYEPLPINDLCSFEILEWAVGLKAAFWELEQIDHAFKPFNLTKEEWDDATAVYEFFKELRDISNSFSDCKYTTPNVYFPKICHLYRTLLQRERSEIGWVRQMASDVREEIFDEYWTKNRLILTITMILDPRFKLDIVRGWYKEIFNGDIITDMEKIIDEVTNICSKYLKAIGNSKTSTMLDSLGRPCTSLNPVNDIASIQQELDRYLKDLKVSVDEDFDILAWWSFNSQIYPTLARMARDYLAIPIGVKNSLDSSLLNKIKNIIKCEDLDDDIKKALVYTKAWL